MGFSSSEEDAEEAEDEERAGEDACARLWEGV